jgi:hypothetical protein
VTQRTVTKFKASTECCNSIQELLTRLKCKKKRLDSLDDLALGPSPRVVTAHTTSFRISRLRQGGVIPPIPAPDWPLRLKESHVVNRFGTLQFIR